jgi:hypothetical protein
METTEAIDDVFDHGSESSVVEVEQTETVAGTFIKKSRLWICPIFTKTAFEQDKQLTLMKNQMNYRCVGAKVLLQWSSQQVEFNFMSIQTTLLKIVQHYL